ncbi:guanitoxin biosynthesis heme-dependent pre-guanitoxin N-hydroxylase GntA [Altererythrobacter aquiaggeris]|uniref:guanitoxin biosynthesis heme-dependent pre-guanitoxin N-hydroxylase GntA n=1 Tax=Aestuarierythrobacter aquiaggeris TaxID=1898396 RepID=UPI003AFA30E5
MLVAKLDAETAERDLFARISGADFPCVGAKSAMARGTLKVLAAHSLDSGWDDLAIHRELMCWASEYRAAPGGLRSLAVVFDGPHGLTETGFEQLMWQRIQSFADKDAWLGQPYDHRVSADPDDPHFSLSFGGEGFFVVGLHPSASRPARRFSRPTMVFNLHDQFEALRQQGRYNRMRDTILKRDEAFAGSPNPMLSNHGEASAARQYSGRAVNDEWRCPFSDKRAS